MDCIAPVWSGNRIVVVQNEKRALSGVHSVRFKSRNRTDTMFPPRDVESVIETSVTFRTSWNLHAILPQPHQKIFY
jgi:hypothetical protein